MSGNQEERNWSWARGGHATFRSSQEQECSYTWKAVADDIIFRVPTNLVVWPSFSAPTITARKLSENHEHRRLDDHDNDNRRVTPSEEDPNDHGDRRRCK
jgi:hypothetical protein